MKIVNIILKDYQKIINVQYKADQTSEKIKLHEPLKIDKLSDIYLNDLVSEHGITGGDGSNRDLFILGIDEFNIQSDMDRLKKMKQINIIIK